MAMSDHRRVSIVPGDTVIISASTIPGNERMIGTTINRLFKQGAQVIYEAFSGFHVSGHASQEAVSYTHLDVYKRQNLWCNDDPGY